MYRGVLPIVRDRHCELQVTELEQIRHLSTEAARRYLKRIQWIVGAPHRLWLQSCFHTLDRGNTVFLVDTSESAKSWIHEAIEALRMVASDSAGKFNFIQFNGNVYNLYTLLI